MAALFAQAILHTDQHTTSVRRIIRSGSPRMPTYGPQVLGDEDLDDLVTFLRENCGTSETGGGCFDEHNPPPNPFYQYEVTGLSRRQDQPTR